MTAADRTWPWSERHVAAAIWLGIAAYAGPLLLIGATASALGAGREFTDVGDPFEKAAVLARYADVALARAAAGNAIPEPPRLLGDVVTARIAWSYAILSAALFASAAILASRQPPAAFIRATGLGRLDVDRMWLPGAAVAVLYLGAGLYARGVEAAGIDALVPAGTRLDATLRDTPALALYGLTTVVAAPIGEELFYRGLVFGGLASWGFVPSALVSSVLFALSHLDPGSLIPFTLLGMTMAWLYWRSGSLWDAIAFHVLFNLLSFMLLIVRTQT
jgi:membrane protease YdiL (CAAX protease family)